MVDIVKKKFSYQVIQCASSKLVMEYTFKPALRGVLEDVK